MSGIVVERGAKPHATEIDYCASVGQVAVM